MHHPAAARSLFVYIGRPTRIIARCRLPLMINLLVALVLVVNEEVRVCALCVCFRAQFGVLPNLRCVGAGATSCQ